MPPEAGQPDPAAFLAASDQIDFHHPVVAAKAAELRGKMLVTA